MILHWPRLQFLGGAIAIYLEHTFQIHEVMIGNINLSETLAYFFSLLFCVGAALIFTFLKNPKIKIPIEAFIGIAYALATTAAVIILDKGAGSDVHLHDMLAGVLLWTSWPQVLRLAIVFVIVGGFHVMFRKKFIQLTDFYTGTAPAPEKTEVMGFPLLFQLWNHDH